MDDESPCCLLSQLVVRLCLYWVNSRWSVNVCVFRWSNTLRSSFRLSFVHLTTNKELRFNGLQRDIHCTCLQGVKRFECEQCKQRLNVCLWLIYITRDGLGLGFPSFTEIGSRHPSLSLCNVNVFCIVQCRSRVWNPNPSLYPSVSPVMKMSHYRECEILVRAV